MAIGHAFWTLYVIHLCTQRVESGKNSTHLEKRKPFKNKQLSANFSYLNHLKGYGKNNQWPYSLKSVY